MFTRKKRYSIGEIAQKCKNRQANKFDAIIAISGNRGQGKSTIAYKIASLFKGFKAERDIVYSRKELNKALATKKYGVVMADEMVIAGYKRTFWDSDQIALIQMINTYRDSCNVLIMCIPSFASLDKDLRKLVKFRIHVIRRGLSIVHVAKNVDYKDDPWDFKYNQKIEEDWSKKHIKSPKYTKLSTFAGYLAFGDLKPLQKIKYQRIKEYKRNIALGGEAAEEPKETKFYDTLADMLLERKVTREDLDKFAMVRGVKTPSILTGISLSLKRRGIQDNVQSVLKAQQLADKAIQEALNHPSNQHSSLLRRKEAALK